jgi:molybdopterin-guanine dinucleotide biosynthesis protein A
MEQIEAFILAGGASRRMGSDKARLVINGKTFLQQIAETLQHVASNIVVVGQDSQDLAFTSVADVHPQWGALGGIHTALTHCKAEWAIIVACDLPFVTAELFKRLSDFRPHHEAVVPIQSDLVPQPLCGFYKVNPCLDQATQLIGAGKRRPLDLLQNVNTKWVPFSQLEDLHGATKFFVNINTPEDYYEASRKGTPGED